MAQFNEASFQSTFLSELRSRYGAAIIGATREPPLRQERDLGFDAMLRIELGGRAVPVFFQFKSPKVVRMPSGDGDCWSYLAGVHYRFDLRKDRKATINSALPLYRQHNLLVILRRRFLALYASPLFHSDSDLDTFTDEHRLHSHTLFVDPEEIGPIRDRDEHHVSYSVTGTQWAFHSEFQPKGSPRPWRQLVDEELRRRVVPINPGTFSELAGELRDLVESEHSDIGEEHEVETTGAGGDAPEGTLALVSETSQLLRDRVGAALVLLPVAPWGMPDFGEEPNRWWWF